MSKLQQKEKYTWEEYLEFLKENRIRLAQCHNGDVMYYTEYSKYIGKNYLTVKKSDYSESFYAPKNKPNTIVFKWGQYSITKQYERGQEMPESIDYLLEALNWYKELRAHGAK